jgi:6-pyruvoyltetrahydropterin/6-carboxytetrahydropterin synthase
MPRAYLTRIVEFEATHELPGMDSHGHRYQCRVTVTGDLVPERGGVMHLKTLDELLRREVREPLHQRNINEALPEFGPGRWQPTGEALAVYVWRRLAGQLPAGVTLHAVRIQESQHLYSEYFGDA